MKIEAFYSLAFVLRIANIKSFNFYNDYDARFLTILLYIMTFKFGKKFLMLKNTLSQKYH